MMEKVEDRKFELVKSMNTIVKELNNEEAYYGSCIYIVPDEADDEDFRIENEPTNKVYKRYQEYCLANSLQPMSNIEFSKQVNRILNFKIIDKKINGKKYRIFVPAE